MSVLFSYASLDTPRPLLSWSSQTPPTSLPGDPPISGVSPSPYPLPGSGLALGPRGAGARWGPQWGGRAASMAAVRRRPPVPARPAQQAPRRGGQAGQAAWGVTRTATTGGEGRGGSAQGTRKGKSRWTGGRGGLTLLPPAPPRKATRPQAPGTPVSRPPTQEDPPYSRGRPELGSPHLPWQQPCHWSLGPRAQRITTQGSCC